MICHLTGKTMRPRTLRSAMALIASAACSRGSSQSMWRQSLPSPINAIMASVARVLSFGIGGEGLRTSIPPRLASPPSGGEERRVEQSPFTLNGDDGAAMRAFADLLVLVVRFDLEAQFAAVDLEQFGAHRHLLAF